MLRWLKTLLAVACWSFVLVGGVGLAEGISQWLRFDLVGGQNQPLGPLRLLAPYLVLYGWLGLLGGVLVFVPAVLVSRWATRPRRVTFALSVAGALAFLVAVYAGYVGTTHLWPAGWAQRYSLAITALLALVWVGSLGLVYRPSRHLADWMARQKTRTLAFPTVAIIVATAHWPDWRMEGLQQRTGHLQHAAAGAAAQASAPNLILITIDTWRHDHLSLTHADAPPTPHLDKLARDGILLTNVWSVSPWTLPSMATVMTGLPPRALASGKYVPLPVAAPTLAEIAWRQGYATTAFATNPYLTSWYGFDRGFEFFEHSLVLETLLPAQRSVLSRELHRHAVMRFEANSANHVVERVMRWLDWHEVDRPLFLWLHFMNPHLPYRWRDLPDPVPGQTPALGREPDLASIPDDEWFSGHQYKGVMHIRTGEFVPDARQQEALRTLYAREVQFTDHWLGRLFTALQHHDLWGNSVVAVLADHGEEFWEHGGFEHGHSVMPEVCRVPWILRLPGQQHGGQQVQVPLTTLDVVPTLCHLLNWPAPHQPGGRSIFDVNRDLAVGRRWEVAGQQTGPAGHPVPEPTSPPRDEFADEPARVITMENLLYEPQQQAGVLWPWLVVRSATDTAGTWYDLLADPGATKKLPPPPSSALLLAKVDTLLGHWDQQATQLAPITATDQTDIPPELKQRLEALGY